MKKGNDVLSIILTLLSYLILGIIYDHVATTAEEDTYEYLLESETYKSYEVEELKSVVKEKGKLLYFKKDFYIEVKFKDVEGTFYFEYRKGKIQEREDE